MNFLRKKLPKTPTNFAFEKKTVSKCLLKKFLYTKAAYNAVEKSKSLSRKKSNSRYSSNKHRIKKHLKSPLNFAFEKRPYRNVFHSEAYQNSDRKTVQKVAIKKRQK